MNSKRSIIIVSIIIVTYLLFAIIFFGWEEFMNKFYRIDIMLSNGEKWQLKDDKWYDIEDEKQYNWKEFNVYVNNQLLGKYDLLYNNKWYIFDESRNSIKYNGKIFAIKGNKKYEIIDFDETDFDETGQMILKDILNEKNVDYPEQFTYAKKVIIDVDGDQNEETIYTVSNAFTYETDVNQKFSLIFVHNKDNQVLYQTYVNVGNQYDLCVPKVNSIIDIGADSNYEIIFECNYFSEMGSCGSLYELRNGTYKLRKSC